MTNHVRLLVTPKKAATVAEIERMTGHWREVRPRGRPRLDANITGQAIAEQGELPL